MNKDLVIIGGEPAGMAAALEAYEAGVKDLIIIERDECLRICKSAFIMVLVYIHLMRINWSSMLNVIDVK